MAQLGQLAAHRSYLLELRAVLADDGRGLGITGHPLALLGGAGRVDRHLDCADRRDGKVGVGPFRPRRGQDADPLAGPDPQTDQAAREFADDRADLAERDLLPGAVALDSTAGRSAYCSAARARRSAIVRESVDASAYWPPCLTQSQRFHLVLLSPTPPRVDARRGHAARNANANPRAYALVAGSCHHGRPAPSARLGSNRLPHRATSDKRRRPVGSVGGSTGTTHRSKSGHPTTASQPTPRCRLRTEGVTTTAVLARVRADTNAGLGTVDYLGPRKSPISLRVASSTGRPRLPLKSELRLSVQSGLVKLVWVKLLGGWPGLGHLVVCERQLRCPVTRRAARRAERGALDGRRVGAIGVVCARVPMLILVHGLGLAPGRRHDGDGVPAWGRARRPLSLWRPSTRAWRQRNAGSWPRCIGLRRRARTREAHAGASPSSPRSLRVW